jgi:hypothetical protein
VQCTTPQLSIEMLKFHQRSSLLAPGIMTTRTRVLPSIAKRKYSGNNIWYQKPPGYPSGPVIAQQPNSETAPYLGGTQTTVSEGHQISQLRKAGLGDIGGPFVSTRSYCDPSGSKFNVRDEQFGSPSPSIESHFFFEDGILIPRMQLQTADKYGRIFPFFPNSAASSNDDLDELGATAIARCNPVHPPASAATALGEIFREGLPHMIGSQTWKARNQIASNAGKDYLNVAFGWRPLIGDVTDFANTVTKFDEIASQYERDSGKVVRRRYEFPTEKRSNNWEENTNPKSPAIAVPAMFFDQFGTPSSVFVSEETEIRRWFSGAFTYHLPSGYDSRNKLDRLSLLANRLGLRPTPDTLWELTPWSWAADWFSNAGDVISNVSDFASAGLVMRYGYMMEHSIVRRTYFQPYSGYRINGKQVAAGPFALVTETKQRRQANPFGFGVSWDGLSTFQASILAALGISRRR